MYCLIENRQKIINIIQQEDLYIKPDKIEFNNNKYH